MIYRGMKYKRCLLLPFFTFLLFTQPLESKDIKREIDSVNTLPYEFIISNLISCKAKFSLNAENARAIGYKSGEAKALGNLAIVDYLSGEYEKSTSENIRAIRLYEQLEDYAELARLYGEYGYQIKRRDMDKAVLYLRIGMRIAREKQLDKILIGLLDNYGVLKEMNGDLDSAMFFFEETLKMKYRYSDSVGIPYTLNNIAGIYAEQGNFHSAFKFLNLSDAYRSREKGAYGRAENLEIRGDLYLMQGKLDSAVFTFTKRAELSGNLGLKYFVQYSYQRLAEVYEKRKEFPKALLMFKKYTAYKDSISGKETNEKIAELQVMFETEMKDKVIAANALKIEQRTLLSIILGGVIVVLVILSVWTYLYQKMKRKQIKSELELKNRLNKADLENKLWAEKIRISRELHDNIGSQLTFLISSLDNLSYNRNNHDILQRIASLHNFGKDTLTDLRNTVWAISTKDGDMQQLLFRINDLIRRVTSEISHVKILLKKEMASQIRLTSTQMLNIFRIIQEALQNSIKHAESSEILIGFREIETGFLVSVHDNGKGFDPAHCSEGNGLRNMKSRCEEAGGCFSINGNENGTRISCMFPVNKSIAV